MFLYEHKLLYIHRLTNNLHTWTHTSTYKHTYIYILPHIHIYSHTCRHMYAYLHILNSLYIYFFTYLHSHKHILMHTHVYILIHTHTHTHTTRYSELKGECFGESILFVINLLISSFLQNSVFQLERVSCLSDRGSCGLLNFLAAQGGRIFFLMV